MSVDYGRRHLRFGWWSLLLFATLGLVLESLQGLKVRAYLDVSNETRRLMWTLAHAHGTLLAIVHVIFALTWRSAPASLPSPRLISASLIAASVLLPGGFFLGGVTFYSGETSPCPCIADGVMLATQASPGQGTLQVATEKAPAGTLAVVIVRDRKTGAGVRYSISDAWMARIADWNKTLDPAGRYAAVMGAPGLFDVAAMP